MGQCDLTNSNSKKPEHRALSTSYANAKLQVHSSPRPLPSGSWQVCLVTVSIGINDVGVRILSCVFCSSLSMGPVAQRPSISAVTHRSWRQMQLFSAWLLWPQDLKVVYDMLRHELAKTARMTCRIKGLSCGFRSLTK